jgi:cytoskeletal protein CcmA (bactofilin family)
MWNRETNKAASPAASPAHAPAAVAPAPVPVAPVQAEPAPFVPVPPAKAKGSTLVLKGELSGSEDLILEGHVEGKVSLPEHVLTIGPGATVTAEVVARVVVLHGTLSGNVSATERVELRASGRMTGDLVSPRVIISDGATFNGRLETRAPGKQEGRSRKTSELVAVPA